MYVINFLCFSNTNLHNIGQRCGIGIPTVMGNRHLRNRDIGDYLILIRFNFFNNSKYQM